MLKNLHKLAHYYVFNLPDAFDNVSDGRLFRSLCEF